MESDAELIYRVLSGDDEAFTTLVRRYQKSVHALAWRRIGDFHCAEEIAQEVFLRAYKGLSKLKDPNQFPGWLYVITNLRCNSWLEKNTTAHRINKRYLRGRNSATILRTLYVGGARKGGKSVFPKTCRTTS